VQIFKKCDGNPENDYEGIKKGLATHMLQWKSPNSLRPKKVRQEKCKEKRTFTIFLDINGTVYKQFIPVGQSVNSTYYSDVLW
jgi:hypothetical protein